MKENPRRKVSILAHPMGLLAIPAIGIFGALMTPKDVSFGELRMALFASLAVGLLTIVIVKLELRKCRNAWAEFYITPYMERYTWRMLKLMLLFELTIIVGMLAASEVAHRLNAPEELGLSVVCILCILAYPEQKAIYETAKAKLREV